MAMPRGIVVHLYIKEDLKISIFCNFVKGSKTTLHSIIEQEVQLGSMLHFNEWADYNGLS